MSEIPRPKFNNSVYLINIGQKLELQKIYIISPSTKLITHKMNAVVMKLFNPTATGLIFATGKIVLTGVKSEEEMHQATNNLLERIKQCGYPDAKAIDIQLQNLVASVDVGFHIKLGQLHDVCKIYCSYEPELFPGLVYRMEEPKLSIMIFNSGKINLTGSKSQTQILDAFTKIYPLLYQCKY